MPRLCPCQAAFRSKLRGGDSSIFRCEGHGANRWLPTMTTLPEAHSPQAVAQGLPPQP